MQPSNNYQPLISVVTVVLNGEKSLEETILSIIGQTYNNLEYIIIDGESTDGTLNIVKKYKDHINYLVSEPDQGIYDAMNKGIDLATGEYINFLNCGDTFFDKNVIQQIFSVKQIDADVIFGDTQFVYENGYIRILKANKMDDMWKGMRFYHQSAFVKTVLAKQNKFDLDYKIAADYNFLFELYQKQYIFRDVEIVISKMATGGLSYNKRVQAWQECRKSVRSHT